MNEKQLLYICYITATSGLILLLIIGQQKPEEKTIQEALKSPENIIIKVNATITRVIPGAKSTVLTLKDRSATITVFLRKKTEFQNNQQVTVLLKKIQERWEVKKITQCSQPCLL